jgi:ribosomal protein L29
MKIKELKQKTANELQILLKEDRAKLQQLHFDMAGGKLKNNNQLKFIRRQIAQILTIIGLDKKSHE